MSFRRFVRKGGLKETKGHLVAKTSTCAAVPETSTGN